MASFQHGHLLAIAFGGLAGGQCEQAKTEKQLEEEKEKAEEPVEDAEEEIIDFGEKKKKSKKKGVSLLDEAAKEATIDEEKEEKEKKKKNKSKAATRLNLNEVDGHEPFTYEFLLNRIAETIQAINGGEASSSSTFRLLDPQCARSRTKSTWVNFDAQVQALNRKH